MRCNFINFSNLFPLCELTCFINISLFAIILYAVDATDSTVCRFAMEDEMSAADSFDGDDGLAPPLTQLHWDAGSCSRQGKRNYNEDRLVVELDLQADAELTHNRGTGGTGGGGSTGRESFTALPGGKRQAYCGIYDGHSGVHAAIYLKENLHRCVYRCVAPATCCAVLCCIASRSLSLSVLHAAIASTTPISRRLYSSPARR